MSVKATVNSLGQLFVKTKTSHLDHEVLFGALLEIAERAQNEHALNSWRVKFEEYAEINKKSYVTANGSRMTISFKSQTSLAPEIKEKLKEMKFKWNEFRGEYYGFGDREALRNLLAGHECNIETISV